MCDNCAEARKVANQVAEDMSRADRSREFYRRQGECRERERIIKLLEQERLEILNNLGDADLIKGDAENLDYIIALIKGDK